tara:strand:- start:533 stop:769 length:237 start_codon:yes stop_codon:yes gene_type:complete
MQIPILIGGIIWIIIVFSLHRFSVNQIEWFSSFHYPEKKGQYLIQDYETKKYEVATYDEGWFFKGSKPINFKWRKLDN